MKMRNILQLLVLGELMTVPLLMAQDSSEGFVFTEEEVAAAEAEEQSQLQALLSDGQAYFTATQSAHSDILFIVGNTFRAISREVDYVECADAPTPRAIFEQAAATLASKYGVDPSSGQMMKGVLFRENLQKANPRLNPKAYAAIERQITALEVMFKWFYGDFGKICSFYNEDYFKELQKVARFKELTESSEFREMDTDYGILLKFVNGFSPLERAVAVVSRMNNEDEAIRFFERFHNRINRTELDAWCNEVTLGGTSDPIYNYLRFQNEQLSWAPTAKGAQLANYESRFDYWTKDTIKAAVELGKAGIELSLKDSDLYQEYAHAAEKAPGDLFGVTFAAYNERTKRRLFNLGNELYTFEDFLKKETTFLKNMEARKERSLRDFSSIMVNTAKSQLKELQRKAEKFVPQNHPSRQRD